MNEPTPQPTDAAGSSHPSAGSGDDDRVMELFELAMAQPEPERDAYLRAACAGDNELLECVLGYVRNQKRLRGFLEEPLLPPPPPEKPFAENQLIDGRFRIIREVARGAMGIVYEAFDETLERRIAIKCAQLGFHKRLPPEVRNAREITHPNVCKIFDLHNATTSEGKINFITMEFLEGDTLAQRLERGRLSEEEALLLARQLCAGLAEAHRNHVIHGDLKASNIILATNGGTRAVITDFGLARRPESVQRAFQSGARGGTPAYMAPELWKGEKATVQSDIYALGVILCELMTGQRPRVSDTPGKERRPLSRDLGLKGSLSHHRWAQAIQRCLDPDPARRFSSVNDITAAPVLRPSRGGFLAKLALGCASVVALFFWLWFPKQQISSVAVLPFLNGGNTPESEFLAQGLSEGLLDALSQLPDLTVIARSSAAHFRGGNVDLRKAARVLNVRALITGRVAQLGKSLRVTVELVDGVAGKQMWGRQYNREISDLSRLEEEISGDVVHQIRSNLTSRETTKLAVGKSVKPEAYELLLRGRYQMRLYSPESSSRAISYFEQAIAIDPHYALAEVELANVYRRMGSAGVLNPREALPLAEAAARRALGGAKDLAEAHAALADVKKDQWDWKTAEAEYRRAVQLNPNLAAARQGLAIGLSVMSRHQEALAETLRLRNLDPIGSSIIDLAATYYNMRRFDDALFALGQAADRDPSAPAPWTWTGIVRGARGEFQLASKALEKAVRLGDFSAATQCYYVYDLARNGSPALARQVLARIEQPGQFVPPSSLAIAYTGLGDRERAFQLLEQGFATRDPLMQYIGVEAHFDDLRKDQRFQELLRKIGIPSQETLRQ